jgi:K+-sensing histidine kinase KdpD
MIVAPSADLDMAVRAIVFSAVGTAGQRCTSLRRVIAHRSIRADLTHTLEAFLFLVPVVAASWLGGVWPGVVAAIVSSALFNVGFLPPYGTFDLERHEYLGAFLGFLAL